MEQVLYDCNILGSDGTQVAGERAMSFRSPVHLLFCFPVLCC